ncbi:MAG TPA: tetratricopeptide repeat protein [Myxococcales bacterium]
MRSVSLVAVLACLLAVAAVPATGWAAEDSLTRKKVQTYLDLAADLFKSADYAGALQELQRAEQLSDLAVVRYNIARCFEELRRDGEAISAFEKYLALNDTTPGASDRMKRAQETVARLKASGAATPPPANAPSTLGTLEIACPTAGSSVMIIGLMQTPVACPWRSDTVPAGSYDVQTMAPGQAPLLTRAEVAIGRTTAIIAQATRAATAPVPVIAAAPQPAYAMQPANQLVPVKFVTARDGDNITVTVDNSPEMTCKAPCELNVPAGRHVVKVEGEAQYVDDINVPRNSASTAKIGRSKPVWLALGIPSVILGPVTFVAGVGYGLAYDNLPVGATLMVTGIVVAVVGGVIGFKFKGNNAITLDRERGRHAERETFDPQLLSVGLAPIKGGGMMGATFAF